MVQLTYLAELDFVNTKGILFSAKYTGKYGVAGAGDLLNLTPSQNGGADGGIEDPKAAYYNIIEQPPIAFAVLNDNLAGYYTQIVPNAVPSLINFGLGVFASEGNELTTAEAYPAGVLAGSTILMFLIPGQQ